LIQVFGGIGRHDRKREVGKKGRKKRVSHELSAVQRII